jgi:hypothetical protein
VTHKIAIQLRLVAESCTVCSSETFGYMDDRCSRVRFPTGAGNFSLHHRVQKGSGAHTASYPMGTRGSFLGGQSGWGVKLTTRIHLVPRSRMLGAIPPFPQYAFMAWCFVKHRDNFTFTSSYLASAIAPDNDKFSSMEPEAWTVLS